jgi:DNA polymerase
MESNHDQRLRAIALGRLESLERAGVMQLPKARAIPAAASPAPAAKAALPANVSPAVAPLFKQSASPVNAVPPTADRSYSTESTLMAKSTSWKHSTAPTLLEGQREQLAKASQAPSLTVLQQEVAACTQCTELATLRTQTVFGVGNPKAKLCFMGEAPGADEDRLGEPFVGRAGQLLNKIIEACRLKREDVYILNMIKCRPPGNRNPLPQELANCRSFLERQLDLIQPEFICCLGAVASQNLLNTTIPIGKLRGKLHAYRGAKVVCTFHPAYLLRNPAAKKDAWDDMKFLFREMGVEL